MFDSAMTPDNCGYLIIGIIVGFLVAAVGFCIGWTVRNTRWSNEERRRGGDRRKGC
jgi:hypothetical protein